MNYPHDLLNHFRLPVFAPDDGTGTSAEAPDGETPNTTAAPADTTTSEISPEEEVGSLLDGEAEDGGESAGANTADAAPEPLTRDSFKLPEGVEVPEESFNQFLELMNNSELDPAERAQGLLDLQLSVADDLIRAAEEAGIQQWTELQKQWQEEAKALPKIGGEKLPETLGAIRKGLEKVDATDETFQAFNLTGAGNNPEIIRIMHALVQPFLEGSPVLGDPPGGKLAPEDILFGGNKQQE